MSIIFKALNLQGKFLLIWNPLLIPLPIAKRILEISQKIFLENLNLDKICTCSIFAFSDLTFGEKTVIISTCHWPIITKFAVYSEAFFYLTSFWIGLVAQVVMSDNQLCRPSQAEKKAFSFWPSERAKSSCQLSIVRLPPNFQGN